jgi:hypothetical protein
MEPYGIAIPRDGLIALGAKPVIYGTREDFGTLAADETPFFRLNPCGGVDRSGEKEWRVKGDVSLAHFVSEDLFVAAPRRDEAEVLAEEFHVSCLYEA